MKQPLLLVCFVGMTFLYGKSQDSIVMRDYSGWGRSDTIHVMLLCSDTTKQKYTGANKIRKADGYTVEINNVDKHRVPFVWWMFGYMVVRLPRTINWMPIYLNDKKEPLNINVIVWQAIETNPIKLAF
jgi:hypothetical protein